MIKFLGVIVKKQIFVIFPSRNTQLSLYVWSQKIVTKGALYFQFLGIPNPGFVHEVPKDKARDF